MAKRTVLVSLSFLLAVMIARASPTESAQSSFPVAPVGNGSQQVELGDSALALMGPWKFRLGHDVDWAMPDFDDSGWENVTLYSQGWSQSVVDRNEGSDPGWAGHRHQGAWGYGWYRIRLNLQKSTDPLSLFMPFVDSVYTIYWDGQVLGGLGNPAQPKVSLHASELFTIPKPLAMPRIHVLAIQVWDQPFGALQLSQQDGGLRGAPLLVSGPIVAKLQQLAHRSQTLWLTLQVVPDVTSGAIGIFILALFRLQRRRLEYLWIGLTLLCFVIHDVVLAAAVLTGHILERAVPLSELIFTNALLPLLGLLAAIWLVNLQRRRWLLAWLFGSWGLYFLFSMACAIDLYFVFFSSGLPRWYMPVFAISFGNALLILLYVAAVGIRTRGREAWIDLSPGLLMFAYFLERFAQNYIYFSPAKVGVLYVAFLTLIPLSVVAIVVRRFLVQWREHQRIEGEMRQAQTVQMLLFPEKLPQMPGYRVEGTYLAASQVGGDFYQVFRIPDSGLIVVLGDVSGKGLQAAMVVSIAIGAVRAIVKETGQPAEILGRLNHELVGNLKSGFVTCFCARIDAAGTVIMANAGHLSPWINGTEVSISGALPLGILLESVYEAESFHLRDGDTLTIMSDGVVEARRERDGQLYGFDQLAMLLRSKPSAEEIARTAQCYGQEDDISVLQITRLRVAELASDPLQDVVTV